MPAIIAMTRGLQDAHFGVGSERARLSLANELTCLWHVRPNGGQPQGVILLTETKVQRSHGDLTTRVR
eukprot:4927154-Pyramimonas_sp.AAC.1